MTATPFDTKIETKMQKSLYWIIATGAVIVGIYVATQPEPTPAERLSEAVEKSGQQLAEAATDAAETLQQNVEGGASEISASAAEALSSQLAETSQEAKDRFGALMQIWRETGIVTETGVDFDAAISAVEETDMSTDARMQLTRVLVLLRDMPGNASEKLTALEDALKS